MFSAIRDCTESRRSNAAPRCVSGDKRGMFYTKDRSPRTFAPESLLTDEWVRNDIGVGLSIAGVEL
jgi:hypothetical protein